MSYSKNHEYCALKTIGLCKTRFGPKDKKRSIVQPHLQQDLKSFLGKTWEKLKENDSICEKCYSKVRKPSRCQNIKRKFGNEDRHFISTKRIRKSKDCFKCLPETVLQNQVFQIQTNKSNCEDYVEKEAIHKKSWSLDKKDFNATPVVNERVIVDIACLQKLVNRSIAHAMDCDASSLRVRSKSWTNLELQCTKCHMKKKIRKDNCLGHELPINEALVIGSYCGGIGFSATKHLFNSLETQVIDKKTYQSTEVKLGLRLDSLLKQEIDDNVAKEKKLAVEIGDVVKVGDLNIPFITVVVDAGWGKRSYGHSYDSNAGCAVIIGARTNKILFMDYRVRTCVICDRLDADHGEIPREHVCYKNWNDSAQSMEADIIVSGFRDSYDKHGILYRYVIGDADSSVYSRLQSQIVYPGRIPIIKLDCSNHAVRGLNSKIYTLMNASSYPKPDRDLVKKYVNRFGKDVRAAISHNAMNRNADDHLQKTSAQTLAEDISNVPAHIYNDHSKCKAYYCKEGGIDEYKTLKATSIGRELIDAFAKLANRSPRLMFDVTSNYAESFMSLVAKYVSGKRINFSQRGAYGHRVTAAALAYNNGAFWPLAKFNRTQTDRSPLWIHAKKYFANKRENRKRRVREGPFGRCQTKKKTTKNPDEDYGINAVQGRMTDEELQIAISNLVRDLQIANATCREKIQQETVGQIYNDEWKWQRRNRLTASNAGKIYKMRDSTSNKNFLKNILYPPNLSSNENIVRGINQEPKAKSLYNLLNDVEVEDCGIFVFAENGILAASPDGLVGVDGILEIKCPNCEPTKIPLRPDKFLIRNTTKQELMINKKHAYYHQIVMQLHITEKLFCDFFVFYEDPLSKNFHHFQKNQNNN